MSNKRITETEISKIHKLPKEISKKLYSYQLNHSLRLINILYKNNSVLDASDTGTGKTYAAVATVKYMNLKPIIICPKSVISTWKEVTKIFNLNPLMIVNYETIKMGKSYDKKGNRILSKFIYEKTNPTTKQISYGWKIPNNTIFIFDEAHKCRHLDTQNSMLLLSAKDTQQRIMLLSATISDKPENFKIFTYVLNFLDPEQKIDFIDYMNTMTSWMYKAPKPMQRIHNMLYPNRASRIRINDLGDLFPETQIIAQSYTLDANRAKKIEENYSIIAEQLNKLESDKKKDKQNKMGNYKKVNPLTVVLRARQEIELLKVTIFVELAQDFIENGYSVVLFVNFTRTLKTLSEMLKTTDLIYGQQTQEERDMIINKFQTNKSNIIIVNIQAGGVGISLHDKNGKYPRASILSPNWSSTSMVQALGRIHRAGGKSKSLQRIVYAAETVEETIAQNIKNKLKDINSINNGDLDLTNIQFDKTKRKFVKIN